jgi:hypothetical protein
MTGRAALIKPRAMTVESMTQFVENIQSIYTIVLALAVAEAFKQAVRESRPSEETHATTFQSWFECVYPSRLISLVVFLLLAVPFFQGNQKYLYLQYIAPLHQANPPLSISAFWLNLDCFVFTVEAGLFFVMSRSLSARRWQQFYGTVIVLLAVDFIWVVLEMWHGASVHYEWLWFDLLSCLILGVIIVIDWLFVPYQRGKELNIYCYLGVSAVALLGLIYSYFYQLDYLIHN